MTFTRFLFFALPVGAVLAVVLWLFRDPVADFVRPARVEVMLRLSERAMNSGDTLGAHRLARQAWQLQPNDFGALRRLMGHARKLGLGDLGEITLLTFHHPEADIATQQEILRWLLDRGDTSTFAEMHQNMGEQRRSHPEIRLLNAEMLDRQGRTLEAIEAARAAAEVPETAARASLLLTSLLPRLENNPPAWQQARERAVVLIQGDDPDLALRAFRNLRLLPPAYRDPGPGIDLPARVASLPGGTVEDRLTVRQLEASRLPSAEQSAAVDAIIKEFAAEPEAAPALSRWLLEIKQPQRLLELAEDSMRASLSLYSARLQALLEAGRLSEAEAWLADPHPAMSPILLQSLQAGLASKAGRRAEATALWGRAVEQARSFERFEDCATVLTVADRFGETEVAGLALDIILRLPSTQLPPSQGLAFLELRFGDRPELLRRFWEDLARFRGGDPVATEQVALLQLSAPDVPPEEGTSARTSALVQSHPRILRFRTTHALWLMREGKDAEAAAVLRDAPVNWNEASDWDRAVFSLALGRSGSARDAAVLDQGVRPERITPLRRGILAKLSKEPGTPLLSPLP
jgi:tetratricopeptide (TPR) repeat protein